MRTRGRGWACAAAVVLIGVWLGAGAASSVARTTGPQYGRSVSVTVVSGRVYRDIATGHVKVRLRGTTTLPNGSKLDLSHGTARIESRLPKSQKMAMGTFTGTTVTVTQPKSSTGVTKLSLTNEDFSSCHLAQISRYKPTKRYHFQAKYTTDFQVAGASGSAQPTGGAAGWGTTDTCSTTTITDASGKVVTHFEHAPPAPNLVPGETTAGYCNDAPTTPKRNQFCVTASSFVTPSPSLGFSVVLQSTAAQYHLCVSDPTGATTCRNFPLAAAGRFAAGDVSCPAGPGGTYTAQWKIGSQVVGPDVSVRSSGSAPSFDIAACQFIPISGYARTFGVEPLQGASTITLPGGSATPLSASQVVPDGATVDATNGAAALITELPDGDYSVATIAGGAASVTQNVAYGGVADVTMTPVSYEPCVVPERLLNLRSTTFNANPNFRVDGRFVQETPIAGDATWTLHDDCTGTETTVASGSVQVNDPYQGVTVNPTTTADSTCDSGTAPRACVEVASDSATSTARFLVTAITTDPEYNLCDANAAGSTCHMFPFSADGSFMHGEVDCSVAANGSVNTASWEYLGGNYGVLPTLVDPDFAGPDCAAVAPTGSGAGAP
jgi:hypothetical protein